MVFSLYFSGVRLRLLRYRLSESVHPPTSVNVFVFKGAVCII